MGETSNEIERHIRDTREDLSENFSELEEKVRTAVDWRAQFEERPGTMLALAFGGGLLLSALFPSGRSSRNDWTSESRWRTGPDRDASYGSGSASGVGFEGTSNAAATSEKMRKASETWEALKVAAVGMATTKLSEFVEDLIPGFRQEFTKAQASKGHDSRAGYDSKTAYGSSAQGQGLQKSTAVGAD
ncbi:MAG: hypothetical protein NVS9B4_22530 [Candidatus Acidiferrum sp.]